jgi:secreted trypsin-like serine protease
MAALRVNCTGTATYGMSSYGTSTTPGDQVCGATVIDGQWLVTAAHCVRLDRDMCVTVGGIKLDGSDGKTISVDQVIVHEAYDPVTRQNDIALLHVPQIPNYTDKPTSAGQVTKICLPSPYDPVPATVAGAGWGWINRQRTSKLNYIIDIQTFTGRKCAASPYHVRGQDFCAISSCLRDEGGPIFTQVGHPVKQTLRGITSSGNSCYRPNFFIPSQILNVAKYVIWIQGKIYQPVSYMSAGPYN